LLGRESATINSGGEKIFAEEVELALKRHSAVVDVVVCGRPSEQWGQEVVAIVALTPGHAPCDDSLLAEAAQTIARYKLPKQIVYRSKIARSDSGKPDYAWALAQATNGAA
jgi:fatty-acyl-CoA synthase